MNGVIKGVAERLDLVSAQKRAGSPNDLIPPREDDRVTGELGKRFAAHLKKMIEDGAYEPDPALFVQVPKPAFTSRPAALLSLTDRVVYEALVDVLRGRLRKWLLSEDVVMWPRETYVGKRWREFERAPLATNHDYVVRADVAGFYDSIDHEILESRLVQATGETAVARAIREFLSRVMGSRRGIPQGLLPSDTLATAFLQPLDAELLRDGFDYWRHGDDIRMAVSTMSRAREGIATLEVGLRAHGLLINGSKCSILRRTRYAGDLASGDSVMKATREKLVDARIRKLKSSDKRLVEAMNEAELDEQWGWDLFYHGRVSIDEVIDELREHLEPSQVEVAAQLFRETIKRAPDSTRAPLEAEVFHQQLTRSMLRLAAGRSRVALKHAASIIARFPDKTGLVCNYLAALKESHGKEVVRQIEDVLNSTVFRTPWQQAWMCRVLADNPKHIVDETRRNLARVAAEEGHWLARVEAMKVLGAVGALDHQVAARAWRLAPRPLRVDLIAAVAPMRARNRWARNFLDAARHDPVDDVVVSHVTGR